MLNPNVTRLSGYEQFQVPLQALGEIRDLHEVHGQALLFDMNGSAPALVATADFSAADMQQFGVKIHTAMLDCGKYRLELHWPPQVLAGEFQVDRRENALAQRVKLELREYGVPIVFFGYCDSSMYPYREDTNAWFDRPDALQELERMSAEQRINDVEMEMLRHFITEGYLIIKNAIPSELIEGVNRELDHVIANKYYGYEYGSSNRIEGMHRVYPKTQELWLSESWRRYVDLIFRERSLPCQTLGYVFGSQQPAHQDTIHLTPYPKGYMCGTWIALQDVVSGSGELAYYPKSQAENALRSNVLPCYKVINGDYIPFSAAIEPIHKAQASRYSKCTFLPKKGDILIWHESLLHEGSERFVDSIERRSMVIHSFALNSVVYYDATGIPGYVASI
jgi:hypothetical protein